MTLVGVPRLGITFILTFFLNFIVWYLLWWKFQWLNFITTVVVSILSIRLGRNLAFQLIWSTQLTYLPTNRGAILITGASRGLGKSAVESLISSGFIVFAGVRQLKDGETLKKSIESSNLYTLQLDVTNQEMIKRAIEEMKTKLIELNLPLIGLINNAGTVSYGPFEIIPITEIENIMNINVTGIYRVTQLCLPLLRESALISTNHVRIINVSSPAGLRPYSYMNPYGTSKYAVEGLSDCLRNELEPFNIDVVLGEPSLIETDMLKLAFTAEERMQQLLNSAPSEVSSVYSSSALGFAKVFGATANMLKSPPSLFGEYVNHIMRVGDADLSTRYLFGRGVFWLPTLLSLAPDRVFGWYWLIIPLVRYTEILFAIIEPQWNQLKVLLQEKGSALAGRGAKPNERTNSVVGKKRK